MTETREAIEFDRDGAAPLQPAPPRRLAGDRRQGAVAGPRRAVLAGARRAPAVRPPAVRDHRRADRSTPLPEPSREPLGAGVGRRCARGRVCSLTRATDLARRGDHRSPRRSGSGFSLLPIHGALFGTEMLSRAGLRHLRGAGRRGDLGGRVRRAVSWSRRSRRSSDARALPIRRARIFAGEGPHLAPGDVIRGRDPLLPGARARCCPAASTASSTPTSTASAPTATRPVPLEIVAAGERDGARACHRRRARRDRRRGSTRR